MYILFNAIGYTIVVPTLKSICFIQWI